MYALGRITQKHPDYNGPTIGPKMANKNERNFSDEQIRQGRDAHIGLQVQLEKRNLFVNRTYIRTSSCRLARTRAPPKPVTAAWATPGTCKTAPPPIPSIIITIPWPLHHQSTTPTARRRYLINVRTRSKEIITRYICIRSYELLKRTYSSSTSWRSASFIRTIRYSAALSLSSFELKA